MEAAAGVRSLASVPIAIGTGRGQAARMVRPDIVTDALMKLMNGVHRTALTLSGGHLGRRFAGMTTVELRVPGRVSGTIRTTILTIPVHDEDRIVLVASKGGDDRDPEWYRNVLAHPNVELIIDGRSLPVCARPATSAERAELWPRVVAAYDGYASYQERTTRQIPLVVCIPR